MRFNTPYLLASMAWRYGVPVTKSAGKAHGFNRGMKGGNWL